MCEILFLIFGLTSISDPEGKRDEPTWELLSFPIRKVLCFTIYQVITDYFFNSEDSQGVK